eukprot:364198-Chlamydomonas_euryale.AAC.10
MPAKRPLVKRRAEVWLVKAGCVRNTKSNGIEQSSLFKNVVIFVLLLWSFGTLNCMQQQPSAVV